LAVYLLVQSTVVLAAGYHPGHSVLGIIWAAAILAAAIMATLVMNAALGWWWADPAAGYLLVYYALSEGREIAAGSADHGRER
jgi:divalent metal cation (Fe/Co/Zn/Cd) transporter